MTAVQQITTDLHTSSVATNGTSTAITGYCREWRGAGTGLRTTAFIEMKWRNNWSAEARSRIKRTSGLVTATSAPRGEDGGRGRPASIGTDDPTGKSNDFATLILRDVQPLS